MNVVPETHRVHQITTTVLIPLVGTISPRGYHHKSSQLFDTDISYMIYLLMALTVPI